MRISFDIDDTLICYGEGVPCEPDRVPRLLRHWFREPLRGGTIALMQELTARGCSIWLYTSSYRGATYLRWWLHFYGIRIQGVVNQAIHERVVRLSDFSDRPSKYLPAFGIDLHVDDSDGVRMEGKQHGFCVVVVNPDDLHWTEQVIRAVEERMGGR